MPRRGHILKDGYLDVPPGRLAAVVTYLEMRSQPQLPPRREAAWPIVRVEAPELEWYRSLYRAVGQEFLWFSRIRMSDEELSALIRHPAIEIYSIRVDGSDRGFVELDRRVLPEIEIAYFGVTPNMIGRGAGSDLMRHALEQAWSHHPRRVHLHTCTFDHPNALSFYMKWGFKPWKRAIEIAPDPRLTGDTDPSAAPQIPLIGRTAPIPINRRL